MFASPALSSSSAFAEQKKDFPKEQFKLPPSSSDDDLDVGQATPPYSSSPSSSSSHQRNLSEEEVFDEQSSSYSPLNSLSSPALAFIREASKNQLEPLDPLVSTRLPTMYGEFNFRLYPSGVPEQPHVALVRGLGVQGPSSEHTLQGRMRNESGQDATNQARLANLANLKKAVEQLIARGHSSHEAHHDHVHEPNASVYNRLSPSALATAAKLATSDSEEDRSHRRSRGWEDVMIRMHSECLTGDVFGSLRCDCGEQLRSALQRIGRKEHGVLLFLRQEGRGIGIVEKIRAYNLQEQGLDTVEANLALGHVSDGRDYTLAARILLDLGIRSVQLLTNNPAKVESLTSLGVNVSRRVPHEARMLVAENARYLQTKVERMRHTIRKTQSEEEQFAEDIGARYETDASKPFHGVTLSFAQTLDGSIAYAPSESTDKKRLLISGKESMSLVHYLRARHDAILVGAGTVLNDDPVLTARVEDNDVPARSPTVVIVDPSLKTPLDARCLTHSSNEAQRDPPILIAVRSRASESTIAELESRGARVILVNDQDLDARGRLSSATIYTLLRSKYQIHSLMVEGGASTLQTFMTKRSDYVNDFRIRAVVTIAPRMGPRQGKRVSHEDDVQGQLEDTIVRKCGDDIVMVGWWN